MVPLRLRLHKELKQRVQQLRRRQRQPEHDYGHRGHQDPDPEAEQQQAVEFCYVQAHHVKAVNALARRFFWPGIDGNPFMKALFFGTNLAVKDIHCSSLPNGWRKCCSFTFWATVMQTIQSLTL